VAWRDFWAFGNSNIGDFGCHDLDAACWALDLRAPARIDFSPAGPCNEEIGPHGCVGYYHFPSNGQRGPVTVTWYDGGLKPDVPQGWPTTEKFPDRGVLFVGSEGTLFCAGAGGRPKFLPSSRAGSLKLPEPSIPRVQSHARDWIEAIQGKRPAGSNFDYGAKLTELALLGALSLRLGKAVEWDATSMTVKNAPEAAAIVRENYRDGWEVA
jgi:predicted dehydrogenase